ncbi:Aste57867_21095 [Aphanomyces stellatus]|uniref:Aste57867_21095 protein n=1 Tax=Aphanomyces stellatus TaxID=120398 RepID=A0A485LGM8_9STRA|nr:hypothetical protein As57867_021027 [Aphanomyces stellatus]VFT97769.1 Aste57867_21095 [Aphanomyces stellatus]
MSGTLTSMVTAAIECRAKKSPVVSTLVVASEIPSGVSLKTALLLLRTSVSQSTFIFEFLIWRKKQVREMAQRSSSGRSSDEHALTPPHSTAGSTLEFRDSVDSDFCEGTDDVDIDVPPPAAPRTSSPNQGHHSLPRPPPSAPSTSVTSPRGIPPPHPMSAPAARTSPLSRLDPTRPHPVREASCSTFFLGDDSPNLIDVNWMGESLGLELQRFRTKDSASIDIVWKDGTVGLTFGIEQATRQVVVKRTTRRETDVGAGFILLAANGRRVLETNFDATMRELKVGHDAGRAQLLQFLPPPAAPIVKTVDAHSVLGRAGIDDTYALQAINGMQTRYLTLEQISTTLRDAVKPCMLTFVLSAEAAEMQEMKTVAQTQRGVTLAAVSLIVAAACI